MSEIIEILHEEEEEKTVLDSKEKEIVQVFVSKIIEENELIKIFVNFDKLNNPKIVIGTSIINSLFDLKGGLREYNFITKVRGLTELKDQSILVTNEDREIHRFNKHGYFINLILLTVCVSYIDVDNKTDEIWITSCINNALYKINMDGKILETIHVSNPRKICLLENGMKAISTTNHILFILNQENRIIFKYTSKTFINVRPVDSKLFSFSCGCSIFMVKYENLKTVKIFELKEPDCIISDFFFLKNSNLIFILTPSNILVVSRTGTILSRHLERGIDYNNIDVSTCGSIMLSSNHNVIVSDTNNKRVIIF